MAYTSSTGWAYGYFNADGSFTELSPDGTGSVVGSASTMLFGSLKAGPIAGIGAGLAVLGNDKEYKKDGKRIVFLNKETGKTLPYSDLSDGAPGSNVHEQGIGRGAILYYLDTGEYPKDGRQYVDNFIGYNGGKDVWDNYNPTLNTGLPAGIPEKNLVAGLPKETDEQGNAAYLNPSTGLYEAPKEIETEEGSYDSALNAYYKDLYSLNPGTGGAQMYDRLTDVYANQATVAGNLAESQYQQQAMQQAEVVKQITDQVRGERMTRLRSGMSESQIANQDMQMMMTNVDTLNQNASMLNQGRLEAAGAFSTAQDQAYMDYLNQANARGQVGMAGYATDAGNVAYQVQQYRLNNPNVSYEEAQRIVTGYYNANPKK